MLHIEIQNQLGRVCAYKVDHSKSSDEEDLLCNHGVWENIPPDQNDNFYKLISINNKWEIRPGVLIRGVAGEAEVIRDLDTIFFGENYNILGIVIALFLAPPGKQFLREFREFSTVSNEEQLADNLAAHPLFTRDVIGGKSTADQVKELMKHFDLEADGTAGSAASVAEKFFSDRIDSQVGFGAIAAEATFYLLRNDLLGESILEVFKPTSDLFKARIKFADEYSENREFTDLAELQKAMANIKYLRGGGEINFFSGSALGGLFEGNGSGDRISLEASKIARDILFLNNVSDTQIFDINGDGITNILGDSNGNLFFDVIRNFSAGNTGTDDRIDLSNFNFNLTGIQLGLLDVSTSVSITTDLSSVPGLFRDEAGDNHGLAFLKHSINDGTLSTTTYLFIDVNEDGHFTSADDMFLELVGVDDLVDANFIYRSGVSFIDQRDIVYTLTGAASVTEGDSITYTVTASEAVAANTDVVFKTIPSGTGPDLGATDTNQNDFIEGTLVFNPTTITIPAGQTTATVSITASNDSLPESVERLVVNAVVGDETLTTTTNLLDGQSGPIFDLTIKDDDLFVGTDDHDVFNGFVASGNPSFINTTTMTTGDIVDGWIGLDTLSIINASGAGVINTNGADVRGIEILNLRGLTAADTFAFDASSINDVQVVNGSLSLGALTITDYFGDLRIISSGVGNDVIALADDSFVTVKGGPGADTIVTNSRGNSFQDSLKFVYAAGDSVSDSTTTGINATVTDTIFGLHGSTIAKTPGSFAEFDTEVPATAVTIGSIDVIFGTTAVTNGADFFVNIDSSNLIHIYQDTDGDKIIEAGEFAVSLTGIFNGTRAADFSVSEGNLMLITA